MVKRFLVPLLAAVIVMAMVIPGCAPADPVDPVEPDPELIELKFIIRTDLYQPMFPAAGEYVADQLEKAGFAVDRMLLTGPEAFDIWIPDDPMEGTYSAYTGGWGITAIPRDRGGSFYAADTKFLRPWPRWLVLDPPAEYLEVMEALYDRDYSTMEEREALFEQALEMRMEFSPQILLADIAGATPFRNNLDVAVNLAIGIGAGWVQTLHFHDGGTPLETGGTVNAEQYFVLSEPWNPVDGSGASADLTIFRDGLQESGLMPDPNDGLYHPWHIERAEVVVEDGLPVIINDEEELPVDYWLDLEFAEDLEAPAEAWADWCALNATFITVAEKMDAESVYYDADFDPAVRRVSRVYYPDGIFDVPMHDGSTLSMGDFILPIIFSFDRGQEDSPIYDEAEEAAYAAMMRNLRGINIITDHEDYPLIIEFYSRLWYIDAEWNVASFFPGYGIYGQFAPWHVITLGKLAEVNLEAAFGTDKAKKLETVWLDYTKGPSLAVLEDQLESAEAVDYIPYLATMGEYVNEAEAGARYANLRNWYDEEVGHFWTTTAPYYLDSVSPVEAVIELKRFEDHPDPADRWLFLLDPGYVPSMARTGGLVDEIFISEETSTGAAVSKLQAGDSDIYLMLGITDPDLFATIQADASLDYKFSYGSFAEIMFNVAGPVFLDGTLNPFYYAEVREAVNWLVDREYIVDEVLGGMGAPIYGQEAGEFPEYDRYPDLFAAIEAEYAFDEQRGIDAIAAAMLAIPGVELIDGQWHYLEPED